MIFSTERLFFRYFVLDDFDDLFRMYSDPEMREFFHDGVLNAQQTREELEWFLNGDPRDHRLGLWAVLLKSDRRFIGRAGLLGWEIDGRKEIEIAYMIDKSFWRLGYGAEVARGLVMHGFETTETSRLIALIDPEHVASKKTSQAAGLSFWKEVKMDGLKTAVYKIER